MSKKISIDAASALDGMYEFQRSNTRVTIESDSKVGRVAKMYLFGNLIATNDIRRGIRITTAGYNTVTTKDRLNALPEIIINQKNFELYLNGIPWDGDWTSVKSHLLDLFHIEEESA